MISPEIRDYSPSVDEIDTTLVFKGRGRECLSYSYYDRIDAVTYKGWVDGDTHNVDTEGNLRRSFIGTKILPPLNQLDDDRYLKRSLALSLADLAMDIRRLPIDGQLKLF